MVARFHRCYYNLEGFLIELKNVIKSYNEENIIVDDLSFKINDGELIVLIGESGCGKSTILKMINRLIEPNSGDIIIEGKNVKEFKKTELRRKIGYVIQQIGLMPHLTVAQNIAVIPKLEKKDAEYIKNKTMELMELVDLPYEEYKDRYPRELSGGQQQRVGVARALSNEPDIILMDEPFSALDPITSKQLQLELLKIHDTYRKTIVFVTHNIDEAFKLGDRIAILQDGKIIQYDTPEEILKNPVNEFVENFIGKNRLWKTPDMLRASDVMDTNFVKISAGRSLPYALELAKESGAKRLIVVEKRKDIKNICLGMVSTSKLRKLTDKTTKMSDIMTNDEESVPHDMSLFDVLNLRQEKAYRYTPVVDEQGYIVGLITNTSILKVVSDIIPEVED